MVYLAIAAAYKGAENKRTSGEKRNIRRLEFVQLEVIGGSTPPPVRRRTPAPAPIPYHSADW